jgi:hypothetical protein
VTSLPYQYRGRSLERVSYDIASSEVSNWVASPLEGPSPGRANSQSGAPPTIVKTKRLSWTGSDVLIRDTDAVKVSITFSTLSSFKSPQLQYFIDNVQTTGESLSTLDLVSNNGIYEATIPAQPNNSIVRYRIVADLGNGPEVISPRASDPFPWWAYFVTPPVNTTSPVYHMFIKKEDWNQLYDNVNFATDDRRVAPGGSGTNRCLIRTSWDATVPAVFVYNGVVYDTRVRYQGSRWQRTASIAIDPSKTTINPLPDRPGPRALSWKINFPDYAQFEGKRGKVVLSKLNQGCPGLAESLGEQLYGDPSVDVPVQRTRFTRFHVNGGYYHYMMDGSLPDGLAQLMDSRRSQDDPMMTPLVGAAVE